MNTDNEKKIPFKRYFENLDKEQKAKLVLEVLDYISLSYFYSCVRGTFKFSKLMREKLELITKQKFDWDYVEPVDANANLQQPKRLFELNDAEQVEEVELEEEVEPSKPEANV